MSKLVNVPIDAIDANPFRRLGDYPYVERKLETLVASINDVGLWEGVIARQNANRYELAFGHHRARAAEMAGLDKVRLIVRPLTDQQMLEFMGRENMEDYNSDFLVMLETWEAASDYLRRDAENVEDIEIASILGWTRTRSDTGIRPNETAQACYSAASLIDGGYLTRNDLIDLSVKAARQICQRASSLMIKAEKTAKKEGLPARRVQQTKKQIGAGARETARQSRAGMVADKDLGKSVTHQAVVHARGSTSAVLEPYIKDTANMVRKIAEDDALSERLEKLAQQIKMMSAEELEKLEAVPWELSQAQKRLGKWGKKLTPTEVVNLKIVGGDDE